MGGCAAGNGADTIVLAGGSYSLTSVNNDTGANLTGLPVITIAGNGATIARASGAPAFRIFQMGVPFFTRGDLTLNDTTSTGGPLGSGRQGAASTTLLPLTLNNSTVSGNSGGGFSNSGGIFNNGTATLTNSTVSGNSATNASVGGGGIANYGMLTLRLLSARHGQRRQLQPGRSRRRCGQCQLHALGQRHRAQPGIVRQPQPAGQQRRRHAHSCPGRL